MSKNDLFEKAISWAEKKGFSSIKANFGEYEAPVQYTKSGEEETFTPDITGRKRGGKSYFEIALKADNMQREITKWKLLSTLSAIKGGRLFLLAPSGHKAFVERLIKKHNLNAKLVYLPGL
jgi:hypothetical protein